MKVDRRVVYATLLIILLSLPFIYFYAGTPYFTNILVVIFVASLTPLAAYLYFNYVSLENKERIFPQFLHDLADGVRAGLTLPQAVVEVEKIDYGPLTPHVKRLAARISWGVPFETALKKFAEEVGSKYIEASVALILEAYRAGGHVADILETVAEDARRLRSLKEERKVKFSGFVVTIYLVFLIFLFLVHMMINQFIPDFPVIPAGSGLFGVSPGGWFSDWELRNIMFHMLILEAIFSGIFAGVIGEGSFFAGFKHAFVLTVIAILFFFIVIGPPNIVLRIAKVIVRTPPYGTFTIPLGVYYIDRPLCLSDIVRDVYSEANAFNIEFEGKILLQCYPCYGLKLEENCMLPENPVYANISVQVSQGVYTVVISSLEAPT